MYSLSGWQMADSSERDKLIEAYFYKGYTYRTITEFLYAEHGISISVRHLKRKLQHLGVRRRNCLTRRRLLAVIEAISVSFQYKL